MLQELKELHQKYRLQVGSSLRQSLASFSRIVLIYSQLILTLDSTELLELSLLLLFRHLSFYLDPTRADSSASGSSRPEFGLGLAAATRSVHGGSSNMSVAPYELAGLRESLRESWETVAERLGALEFVSFFCFSLRETACQFPARLQTPKNVGSSHRSRDAYLGLSLRRLSELLGGSEE